MYKYLNHVRQGTVYPAGVPEGNSFANLDMSVEAKSLKFPYFKNSGLLTNFSGD